jgi:hypothetical protein
MYSTFPGTFSNPLSSELAFYFCFLESMRQFACIVNRSRVIFLCIIFTANAIWARGVVCMSVERAHFEGFGEWVW